MSSLTSSDNCGDGCGVITEKKYQFEAAENPEFVEHCKKFLINSVSCPGSVSFGFFQELENTMPCNGCQKPSFYLKKIEKKIGSGSAVIVSSDDGDPDSDHDRDHEVSEGGSTQKEYFCVMCYVRKFCNVHTFYSQDFSETYYIFKAKGNGSGGGGILYQSSPIIERTSDSE
jgi:hypothetical protein